MSLLTFVAVVLAIGMGLLPVWLLGKVDQARAQHRFVSSRVTRPEVVRNASIAYALRMAALVPLFALGASGDFWPAILVSIGFGVGVYLLYILRQPLLAFLRGALARDESITVHAYIAQRHGNDPRVRRLAASLTLVALCVFLLAEALVVVALLEPLLPEGMATWIVLGAIVLAFVPVLLSGHSGVMHASQLLLGLIYLGLFGATALLLYLHVSALTPLPPHGVFAVVVIASVGAVTLYYRRSKYVDTDPIRGTASDIRVGARRLGRIAKILNVCVSIALALTFALALMALYAVGAPAIGRGSAAALATWTSTPVWALVALCLVSLIYPLVDVTNWQRLAVLVKDSTPIRAVFAMYAVESALLGLFVCMVGGITAIALPTTGSVFEALMQQNAETAGLFLPLFLIFVLAAALSTMSALVSSMLCTIRYDLLAHRRESPGPALTRVALLAGGGLVFACGAALYIATGHVAIGFTSPVLVAVLLACGCAQLSFAPLILAPMLRRTSGPLSARWALATLGIGVAIGIVAAGIYLASA